MPIIGADTAAENEALRAMAVDALERVTVTFANVLLSGMPIENGHGHEAWMTALEQIPRPKIARVPQSNMGVRSGDPEAQKRGKGTYAESSDRVSIALEANLPFLHKLEVGGTSIKVGDLSGNKGTKVGGASTVGELYAARNTTGRGLLMWRDATGKHFRKEREIPTGLRFMARAVEVARQKASQLGLKKRR